MLTCLDDDADPPLTLYRLYDACEAYHHALSKKVHSEAVGDADKFLPIDALGIVMISHGEQFPEDSMFGEHLLISLLYLSFGSGSLPLRTLSKSGGHLLTCNMSRKLSDQAGTCTFQSGHVARSVCFDVQRYLYRLYRAIPGRDQGV